MLNVILTAVLAFIVIAMVLWAFLYVSDAIADAVDEWKRKRGYMLYRSNHNDKLEDE